MSGRFLFEEKEGGKVGRRRAASNGDERQEQTILRVGEDAGHSGARAKRSGAVQHRHQVQNATGFEVSGQAVSKYLYGEYSPKREFIKAFTDAFELTSYERAELAWLYTYGSRSDAADSRPLSSSGSFVPRVL